MPLEDDDRRAVDRYLHDWLAQESLPGASVAIVRGDELAYATGAGSRDLETNAPANPETLYGVGSVTKSFTALAIAQLHDQGDLDFEDSIADHIDAIEDEQFDATLHDLLCHASGLPSLATSEVLIARQAGIGEYGIPMADWEDFYHHLTEGFDERLDEPRFRYSNSGYVLLGEVVEAVDGRPFTTYVDEEILQPLGMFRSTFAADEYAGDANAATAYWMGGDDGDGDSGDSGPEAVPVPVREHSAAAGGLLTPVTELARYLRFNARGELDGERFVGDGSGSGDKIVSEATLERLHAGHTDTPEGPYGYGWRRRKFLDRTLVGHGGSIGVSTAYVGFTEGGGGGEEDEWAVALACNAAPDHGLAGPAQAMLAAAMSEEPEAVPFVARRRAMESFTGRYESYRGIKEAVVERDGATLRLSFEDIGGGGATPLVPVDPVDGAFEQPLDSGARRPVDFVQGDDGLECHVDRWRLHRVGPIGD